MEDASLSPRVSWMSPRWERLQKVITSDRYQGLAVPSPAEVINNTKISVPVHQLFQWLDAAGQGQTKDATYLAIQNKPDNIPHSIRVDVAGSVVSAIWDSGASCSLISDQLVCQLRIPVDRPSGMTTRGVGRGLQKAIGVIDRLPLRICGHDIQLQAQVLSSDTFNLLLGADFINATNGRAVPKDRIVLLDLEGRTYSILLFTTRAEEKVHEYEAGMVAISHPFDRPTSEYNPEANAVETKEAFYTIALHQPLTIHAGQTMTWSLPLQERPTSHDVYLMEANHVALMPHHIFAANNYGPIRRLRLPLHNTTAADVTLLAGLVIARFEPCEYAEPHKVKSWLDTCVAQEAKRDMFLADTTQQATQKFSDDELMQVCDENMTTNQKQQVLELLRHNGDLFARGVTELGRTHVITH
jgi:hypothetical protein